MLKKIIGFALFNFLLIFCLSSHAQIVENYPVDTAYSQYNYCAGKVVNGKKQGSWVYYKNEHIIRTSYFKNDTLTRVTLIFYENGMLKRTIPFKNGKIVGHVCFYSEEGELIGIFEFLDDEYVSTVLRKASRDVVPYGHAYNPLESY